MVINCIYSVADFKICARDDWNIKTISYYYFLTFSLRRGQFFICRCRLYTFLLSTITEQLMLRITSSFTGLLRSVFRLIDPYFQLNIELIHIFRWICMQPWEVKKGKIWSIFGKMLKCTLYWCQIRFSLRFKMAAIRSSWRCYFIKKLFLSSFWLLCGYQQLSNNPYIHKKLQHWAF